MKLFVSLLVLAIMASVTQSQVIEHRSISGDKQEINAVKEFYGGEEHNIVKRDTAEESHSIAKRAADEPADNDGAINIKEREGLNVAQPRGKKEMKILKTILEEVQSIKENQDNAPECNIEIRDSINTGNSELKKELSSINQNMDNKMSLIISKLDSINTCNSELKEEISSMKQDIDSKNSIIISKLDSIEQVIEPLTSLDPIHPPTTTHAGCPLGFILIDDQCYKFLPAQKMNWTDAAEMCRSLGFTLAQPRDPVGIRKYLVENYAGDYLTWLGARGTGSVFQWQRGGQVLSSSSAYWYPGWPGGRTSSDYCLTLSTHSDYLNSQPNKPYYTSACTNFRYPLCEKVLCP